MFYQTFKTDSQNFVDPRFSKTVVLVKSRVKKYRSRLNRTSITKAKV